MTRDSTASDLLFFIFAVTGSLITFAIALLIGAFAVFSLLSETQDLLPQSVAWFVVFSFLSLAGAPAILFGFRSLRGLEDIPRPIPNTLLLFPITIFPLALGLGYLGFNVGLFPNFLGSAALILGACGSSIFAIVLIQKHSPALSKRRLWGQITIGLWAIPFLAFLGEIILFLPVLLLFVLGAMGSIEGRAILDLLSDPSTSGITDGGELLFSMPWVLGLVFAFVSLLVPLLEEALKSMVIWPLLRRRLSPAEAFLSGVIGGASYGLVEAILLSQQADAWLAVMAARTGATLMHAFTTGIAAWGLAEGVVRKRWDRLAIGYLVAVGFHGLWNALAIGVAVLEIAKEQESIANRYLALESLLPIGIVALIAVAGFGLPRIAKRLSVQSEPQLEIQD